MPYTAFPYNKHGVTEVANEEVLVKDNLVGKSSNNVKKDIVISEDMLKQIIEDISYTKKSFSKIAKENNVSLGVISEINLGTLHHSNFLKYPLRIAKKQEKEVIKQIQYALQYELDKSLSEIAKEYKRDVSVVNDINRGNTHIIPNKTYPLRSGRCFSKNKDIVHEIFTLLETSDIPQKDIARKYKVSCSFVSGINRGSYYFQDDKEYPLRKNYQGNPVSRCFSPAELFMIEEDLKNGKKSIRNIAKEHEVTYTSIININNGATVKYRKENLKYPLRDLRKYKG